ncbi:hypothetical protein RJ639_002990 [Escallonia herrerae]|uniref:Uncharacterized protein n=1 Tax=Escallonia herrerae TaxID=1293975 RepID=A0AA89AX24_9ASTE|nr:hypothetical protein RJ639_002990 [Escallonia herrerae]
MQRRCNCSSLLLANLLPPTPQKGSIRKYVKEYSALMLEIPDMSERQRLCFFIYGLQQWVTTELRWREPHDLAFAMAIVKRLEDFKQGERPRSPRHERAKDRGNGRSKSGLPKATDDERSGDEGCRRHRKGKRNMREVTSRVTLVTTRLMGGLEEDASTVQICITKRIANTRLKEEAAKAKKSKKRPSLLYVMVDVVERTQEALVDTEATQNFMSPRVTEWLRLKPTKEGSWFTAMNAKERLTKGVIKNVDLKIGERIVKADFNIIDMDELGVLLGMDFMEKSSAMLNPYYEVMVGEEGQP